MTDASDITTHNCPGCGKPTHVSGVRMYSVHNVEMRVRGMQALTARNGKRFEPDYVHIHYSWEPGQPWKVVFVDISGPLIRKDGSLSEYVDESLRSDSLEQVERSAAQFVSIVTRYWPERTVVS